MHHTPGSLHPATLPCEAPAAGRRLSTVYDTLPCWYLQAEKNGQQFTSPVAPVRRLTAPWDPPLTPNGAHSISFGRKTMAANILNDSSPISLSCIYLQNQACRPYCPISRPLKSPQILLARQHRGRQASSGRTTPNRNANRGENASGVLPEMSGCLPDSVLTRLEDCGPSARPAMGQ